MNKEKILEALYVIGLAVEDLPPGEKQTKVSVMVTELGRQIETGGEFPKSLSYPLTRQT